MSKYSNLKLKEKGFTLLETLVAIFVITVGLMGGMSAILKTLTLFSFSSSKLTAAYLAQEGIEIVRNVRDTNWLEEHYRDPDAPAIPWDEGLIACGGNCDGTTGNGCMADYNHSYDVGDKEDPDLPIYAGQVLNIDTTNGFYSYSALTPTKFKRKIVITSSGDILNICVRVEWEERGETHQIKVQENLYNWR